MCYNFTIICKKIFIYYNLGGKELERREAIELLKKYNEEEFHIRHALTVEGVMIYFAEQMGYNEDFWGLVGLLHDVDFEKYPEEHCKKSQELDLLLVPGSAFGCPGHFRIAYCVPRERVVQALPRFKQLAQMYGK